MGCERKERRERVCAYESENVCVCVCVHVHKHIHAYNTNIYTHIYTPKVGKS